ncbi:MAG: hypothetical protein Q9162_005434 [Coniocarpon cinnabarinum]
MSGGARGSGKQTICHYPGKNDDFIVYVESETAVLKWREDKTVPLAQVVSGWVIKVSHKQGNQDAEDTPSNLTLDAEFQTHNRDDVIAKIVQDGHVQEHKERGRPGDTNITKGPAVSH